MLSPTPGAGPDDAPLDHAAARRIIVGILLAMMLSALEQTIVGPALPTIGRSLGDMENLSWIVTAYLLAATAATPLCGKLSDIYGRRTIMLISIGVFVVGSVACALAPNMASLIAARTLQGLGGGGILPLAHTIIADVVSPRERPRYQSYTSVMFLAASIAGPVIGGFLSEHLHWSLIFWISLPLGLVAFFMTDGVLRRLPRHDRPHRLDLVGATLMVGAALTLMLALSWGGNRWDWASVQILTLFAASVLLWGLFAGWAMRAPEPFIPLAVLGNQVVRTATVAAFCSVGVMTALSIYVPLYLELVIGLSASGSGTVMIAFMTGVTIGSLAGGRLMIYFIHYKRMALVGLAVSILLLGVLAYWPSGLDLVTLTVVLTFLGAGLGPMYPLTTIVIQNVVLPHQFGTATGSLNFFRLLGSAFMVAAFGAIVIGGAGEAAHDADALRRLAQSAGTGDLAHAFRLVYLAAIAALAVGFVFLAIMEERPLRGSVRVPPTPAAAE